MPYDIVTSPGNGDDLAAPRVVPRSAVARASDTTTSAPSLRCNLSEQRPPGHTRGGRHQPRHVLRAHELVAEAEGGRDGGQLARVRLRLAHAVLVP